jgi:hypothetical protein
MSMYACYAWMEMRGIRNRGSGECAQDKRSLAFVSIQLFQCVSRHLAPIERSIAAQVPPGRRDLPGG